MISTGQLAGALYGTWLLPKLDPRGLAYLEQTPGGFARSFLPALVLTPLHMAHTVLIYEPAPTELAIVPYVVVQFLSEVLSWVAFPFVMLYLTTLLARDARYFTYMVPYNWMQLPLNLVFAPIVLLADVGMLHVEVARFAATVGMMLFFMYGSFIARIGLQIGVLSAVGIVVLDFLLLLITSQLIARI